MDNRRNNHIDPWDNRAYGTGSTEPPRNNGILVTILLILVICLAGAVSALGLLNIRLFQELNQQNHTETAPLSFFDEGQSEAFPEKSGQSTATIPQDHTSLGIAGEEISPFYQRYYRFPQGLYITQVTENSAADTLGLQTGDILISINGNPVTTPAELQSILNVCSSGDTMQIVIYRAGQQYSLQLTLGESGNTDK